MSARFAIAAGLCALLLSACSASQNGGAAVSPISSDRSGATVARFTPPDGCLPTGLANVTQECGMELPGGRTFFATLRDFRSSESDVRNAVRRAFDSRVAALGRTGGTLFDLRQDPELANQWKPRGADYCLWRPVMTVFHDAAPCAGKTLLVGDLLVCGADEADGTRVVELLATESGARLGEGVERSGLPNQVMRSLAM